MNFLFWNLHGRPLQSVVASLASRHRAEVILLAECRDVGAILAALNTGKRARFFLNSTSADRVAVYTRFPDEYVELRDRDLRHTIWRVARPKQQEILLVAAHLRSKLHRNDADKTDECIKLSEAVQAAERKVGHSRTLIVGDLNLNPFEEGMVRAHGLNAVMTRRVAAAVARTVASVEYPFFFNPMWRFFGDHSSVPSGTYYYASSNQVCYFWNIFDQVLVRPDLADAFDDRELRILDSDGRTSFLDRNGVPDSEQFSDHLPVTFSLAL
jgi:hypothetical protein